MLTTAENELGVVVARSEEGRHSFLVLLFKWLNRDAIKHMADNIEITSLNIDTTPETEIKTRGFEEESWPDGQHSPSTATSSRVILEHA